MNEGIINEEASVEKGENARMASFVGAIAIADLVKSTLGPKGMDKILQSVSSKEGKIEVTNDGATILRSVHIDNAAAKVLVDIAKTQDEEVGDGARAASRRVHEILTEMLRAGTTSVAVLCGELLREAEKLIDARVHPQTIAAGWRLAAKLAKAELEKAATRETDEDTFRERLMEIARTTLSSKLVLYEKEHFAKLAVDASEASKVQAPFNFWCVAVGVRCGSLYAVVCIARRSCPSLGRNQGRGAEIARPDRSHSARSEERCSQTPSSQK